MTLYIVGFGGGNKAGMTFEAAEILEKCSLIVGYDYYIELIKKIFPCKEFYSTGMCKEKDRVLYALEQAKNRDTALICSGDAEIYGMAGLAYELAVDHPNVEVRTVAGVTAALSGGAMLGSPLTNDFAVISLSDLLTPKDVIEKRLRGAAEGGLVIALYNPSSQKRAGYLKWTCEILLEYRDPKTVCGVASNIGRDGAKCLVTTLGELLDYQADMFSTVFIGNSETRNINGKMVTPRGYKNA